MLKISKEKAQCVSTELYLSLVFPAKLQSSDVYVGVYLGAVQLELLLLHFCLANMFFWKTGRVGNPTMSLGERLCQEAGGKVRCLAELCLRSLGRQRRKPPAFRLQCDTWVLPLHFQCFLYQICSKLTLLSSAHVSIWQADPARPGS